MNVKGSTIIWRDPEFDEKPRVCTGLAGNERMPKSIEVLLTVKEEGHDEPYVTMGIYCFELNNRGWYVQDAGDEWYETRLEPQSQVIAWAYLPDPCSVEEKERAMSAKTVAVDDIHKWVIKEPYPMPVIHEFGLGRYSDDCLITVLKRDKYVTSVAKYDYHHEMWFDYIDQEYIARDYVVSWTYLPQSNESRIEGIDK